MANAFELEAGETVAATLLCTWYKGAAGLDSQTGQILLTNRRLVFCARNRVASALITMRCQQRVAPCA